MVWWSAAFGSLPGAIVGAVLLILLPEVLRGLGDLRNVMSVCDVRSSILPAWAGW